MSAQITSFSYAQVMVAPVSPVQLLRQVSFEPPGGPTETRDYGEGVLDERRLVGPAGLFEIPIDGDNTSALETFSSADGLPFWVGSESGKGHVLLTQSQSFVKETDAATLEIVVTAALVEALDFNGAPTSSECPFGPSLFTCTLLRAHASFEAELTIVSPEGEDYLYGIDGETPVLDTGGFIELRGRAGLWGKLIGQPWDRTTTTFNDLQFEQTNDADGGSGQSHPRIRGRPRLPACVRWTAAVRGGVGDDRRCRPTARQADVAAGARMNGQRRKAWPSSLRRWPWPRQHTEPRTHAKSGSCNDKLARRLPELRLRTHLECLSSYFWAPPKPCSVRTCSASYAHRRTSAPDGKRLADVCRLSPSAGYSSSRRASSDCMLRRPSAMT